MNAAELLASFLFGGLAGGTVAYYVAWGVVRQHEEQQRAARVAEHRRLFTQQQNTARADRSA